MKAFPKDFYWGAATASYQVEGYNENTDWALAARQGKVPQAGRLADHYHRYEEDLDIAKALGHNAHRLSIEWARIEPREGYFDEEEIEHYRDVLRACKKRGITPFITLWHFTLPLWLSQSGGFERKDIHTIFARYCAKVVASLGDLCDNYSTINEPNVYATHCYLYGVWPPFKRASIFGKKIGKDDGTSERTGQNASFKNFLTYTKVVKNLILSHNTAYEAIKEVRPNALVSVVKHVHVFENNGTVWNRIKSWIMAHYQTHAFMLGVQHKLDTIGLNYYRHTYYGEKRIHPKSDMGWDMFPEGVYQALHMLKIYGKPIVIAEAGVADARDAFRGEYIQKQIDAVYRALQDGIDVRGHMYWSLLDNYEWALGVDKRFGLVEVDYQTLERRPRPSAMVYKQLIEKWSKGSEKTR